MSGKFTPGPWNACEWQCHAATTVKAGNIVIAECSGHGRHSDESLADARLIAAAPELLEACESAAMTLNINKDRVACPPLVEKLRAAIDKARGRA